MSYISRGWKTFQLYTSFDPTGLFLEAYSLEIMTVVLPINYEDIHPRVIENVKKLQATDEAK